MDYDEELMEDDFYEDDSRDRMVDDDSIDLREAAFMMGYEDEPY